MGSSRFTILQVLNAGIYHTLRKKAIGILNYALEKRRLNRYHILRNPSSRREAEKGGL
jgi:hypothetical protein